MPLYSEHPRYITTLADGFLVAIPIKGKRVITKTFRTSSDQSADQVMALAVQWRDTAWQRLFGCPVPARSFHSSARENSVTNIPGVRYIEKIVRKGERRYRIPCIIAEVHTVPGKDYARSSGSRSRLFSLKKYDWEEAIALAAAWRSAFIRRLVENGTELV